jgi:hypothetical protein
MSVDRFGYPLGTDERAVTGDAQLMRVMKWFADDMPRVVARAVAKATPEIVRGVRSQISHPSVRRAIGWRFVAQNAADVEAKIGAAVGGGASSRVSGQRGNRSGVGIDSRNVHWWFLGTSERRTESHRTGRMPAQSEPISVLVERAGGLSILRHFISQAVMHEFKVAE